jgi:serine/threonine protein phosphatase 1
MATWAIGDIHGCLQAFETLLALIRPVADDTVVLLGDVVDRGPDTRGTIDRVLRLKTECRLVTITGNHEEMMRNALEGGEWLEAWLRHGGQQVLDSYGGDPGAVPAEHLAFLREGLGYWFTGEAIFVHANLEPGVALEHQSPEWLRWRKLSGNETVFAEGYRVFAGHTPQPDGLPRGWPGWLAIDTHAYAGGWLSAVEATTGVLFQANDRREAREGRAW